MDPTTVSLPDSCTNFTSDPHLVFSLVTYTLTQEGPVAFLKFTPGRGLLLFSH